MLKDAAPHFGHLPRLCLAGEIDRFGASPSPALSWPKSNSGSMLSFSLMTAAKVRPILLRKPCSGPICFSVISVSISAGSNWRPATIFHSAKSQLPHWNFL